MQKEELIRLRVNGSRKQSWQKWASRRGVSLSSLIHTAMAYYIGTYPLPDFYDEAKMARNLATKEAVNDDGDGDL